MRFEIALVVAVALAIVLVVAFVGIPALPEGPAASPPTGRGPIEDPSNHGASPSALCGPRTRR